MLRGHRQHQHLNREPADCTVVTRPLSVAIHKEPWTVNANRVRSKTTASRANFTIAITPYVLDPAWEAVQWQSQDGSLRAFIALGAMMPLEEWTEVQQVEIRMSCRKICAVLWHFLTLAWEDTGVLPWYLLAQQIVGDFHGLYARSVIMPEWSISGP